MNRLSSALNTSLSGLNLAGRMTQTISNNVANALTEGYASREVIPAARSVGGNGLGVGVGSITRNVDPVLLSERRFAEGQLALAGTRAEFYSDIETLIGRPGDVGALSDRVSAFSASLIEAASRPESDTRLQSVLNAAQSVANKLKTSADAVQQMRMQADQEIGRAVTFINDTLAKIADLNIPNIIPAGQTERYLNAADQRQSLIDQLSEYIPVREMRRDNGTVTLFTPGGAILLDGTAQQFEFSPAGVITADMSLDLGTLSGLSLRGQPLDANADVGKISGGKLAALFDVRDVQAPNIQDQLDAVARNIVERFQDPAVDPTLAIGDAGLFTDAGLAFDAVNERGLANRLVVNAAVDPSQGGELWRLRDGIAAAVPGSVGNATLLNAFSDALAARVVPASGGLTAALSVSELTGEVVASIAATQVQFGNTQSFANARVETLVASELQNGVDTDQEMQRLLLVEQAYAANAKVIATIDELIETLMRI